MVPFVTFAASVLQQSALRETITAHTRVAEADCVAALLSQAVQPVSTLQRTQVTARNLIEALRAKGTKGGVQGLIREYDLSSQEGVALMCLAEALLRIPDAATRDALIRDKIADGNWRSHVGQSPSPFVNAATWGLVVTGKLVGSVNESSLGAALTRLISRGGEPIIRLGVDMAMRMMGEQFVTGQTIDEALCNSLCLAAKGFRYSYDMLGEAATTAEDAARYLRNYETAIDAIGRASAGRGVYEGPGISIKLSALHPRYTRYQRPRVLAELQPRLRELALLARRYDIGLNIDAEEADRLELSLDLLESLCIDPALKGWNGIGFVVQAYQKRAPFVLDWIIDLARRTGHRLMVRLVKGAYWDSEIKRAQVEGLDGFPVFTRKLHTDVSYLACAGKLLAARDAVFPQFATHNAYTVAAIHSMAGTAFTSGDYEFQCLHGMGEPLYEEVLGHNKLNRPVRIYAPVGAHETLLAYLVRRLLENGANSSFVNQIHNSSISVDELVADPVALAAAYVPPGMPHDRIRLPRDLFMPERTNSAGMDLTSEKTLRDLTKPLLAGAERTWQAGEGVGPRLQIRNPADHRDLVGHVIEATPEEVNTAVARSTQAMSSWRQTPAKERAAILLRAADLMEAAMPTLLGLIVREAGKSLSNAVAEIREAVDFLRYYAAQVLATFEDATHHPLGVVVCISPWNFPLAIFVGQVAAALGAGNTVLAKPAEETPLIAAQAVAILHRSGIPADALQMLPGDGSVGACLVADRRTHGVLFTGSTDVARLIQRRLAQRLNPDGSPVPLVAETGGQNCLVVDSSALAEQVVADVLSSAFDSAGQRCSALRVLCLQADVADQIVAMLNGALAELSVGNPDRLSTDIGPVISRQAMDGITDHIEAMRAAGRTVHQIQLPPESAHGTFVPPTIIEIDSISELQREVFGPVLHIVRYHREGLDALIDAINATGYGLTFGIHTRIDEVATRATARIRAGNVYVNRNVVGAVVGVQPFGGRGLSGTGPKAGGPLYLRRLLSSYPGRPDGPYRGIMPGPVGEENLYGTRPRGTVLCLANSTNELLRQIETVTSVGNKALVLEGHLATIPNGVAEVPSIGSAQFDAVLFHGDAATLTALAQDIAARDGPIVAIHVAQASQHYSRDGLVEEFSISTNTTAAGGNANLMMIS